MPKRWVVRLADIDLAGLDQPQEGLHVAALGPAHVAVGVVLTILLVGRVVAAGTVGGGQPQLEFLQVVGLARQIHAHGAEHHHPALPAADLSGDFDRTVVLGARSDQHAIGAVPAAHDLGRLGQFADQYGIVGTKLPGHRQLVGSDISCQHTAAIGLEHLHRQLAEQTRGR